MKNWYVVNTLPRWEKKIVKVLLLKGIENYCPLHKVQKQWSDRKKIVEEPLFKGFVFVQLEESEKWKILEIQGIRSFIYWLGKPATVRDSEIDNIRKYLNEFPHAKSESIEFETGQEVLINQGILMDYKGIILEVRNRKALVKIEAMGLILSAEFDYENLSSFQNAK
jgi:transcription antitermination factor NusG